MKSIVEESSSITKAIEKCWNRAGKPDTFSVKILEYPQKNFFGLTTKSAKVALYFEQKLTPKRKPYDRTARTKAPGKIKERKKPTHFDRKPAPAPTKIDERAIREQKKTPSKSFWTDESVQFCQDWVKTTLSLMQKNVPFTTIVKRQHLIFQFNRPLEHDQEKERTIFRSFAHLIMQALRNKYKKKFRGIKIILNSSP